MATMQLDKTKLVFDSECPSLAILQSVNPQLVRQHWDAEVFRKKTEQLLKDGEFIYCMDSINTSSRNGVFVSRLTAYTEPGRCEHKSIDECAEYFSKLPEDFWSNTEPELKRKIVKIVCDNINMEHLHYLGRALLAAYAQPYKIYGKELSRTLQGVTMALHPHKRKKKKARKKK